MHRKYDHRTEQMNNTDARKVRAENGQHRYAPECFATEPTDIQKKHNANECKKPMLIFYKVFAPSYPGRCKKGHR